MKIHIISTYQEFTDEEINDVENHVRNALKHINGINTSEGLIYVAVKSEETTFKLIGFSPILNVTIKRELSRRK